MQTGNGAEEPLCPQDYSIFHLSPPPLEEALGYIQAVDADSEAIYLPLLDP